MKALLACLAAFALAAPSEPPPPRWSDAIPPKRFQATGALTVLFVPTYHIRELCAPPDLPDGYTVYACVREVEVAGQTGIIAIMPDPCEYAEVSFYAHIQCHENAHALANWKHETE